MFCIVCLMHDPYRISKHLLNVDVNLKRASLPFTMSLEIYITSQTKLHTQRSIEFTQFTLLIYDMTHYNAEIFNMLLQKKTTLK